MTLLAREKRGGARIRRVVPLVAIGLCAAFLAACTSGSDGEPTSGSGAGSGELSPGVTATTVKVGFVISDRGSLGATLGLKVVDSGTPEVRTAGINAIVNAINANGGVGGRTIEPVIKVVQAQQDSPESEEALCRAFTQDAQVFAVYLDGQLQNNARPCYQAGKTIMLDGTLIGLDQTEFQNYGGYLWSPTNPEYGSFVKAQLTYEQQKGFFNGITGVQLLVSDDVVSRRVTDTIVKPFLQSAGVPKVDANYIDSSNAGTLGATITPAMNNGISNKLDRALAIGGARIMPVALSSQEANDFTALWGVTTFDNPTYLETNVESSVPARYPGMLGVGFDPTIDVNDSVLPFPDPANPQQVLCKQIIDAGGAAPPAGAKAKVSYNSIFKVCDAAFFLKAVLDKAPKELTVGAFTTAAATVGDGYRSSLSFGSFMGPNVYAPTNAVRGLTWDTAGKAFVYESELVPLVASQ